MKKFLLIEACLLAALSSCTKVADTPTPAEENGLVPIAFRAKGLDVAVDTKTTAVTGLDSFNVLCTKGSAGNETSVWTVSSVTKENDLYFTGKYWPLVEQTTHFYASNVGMTFQSAGSIITPADMNTDIVYAYRDNATFKYTNTLAFRHIFARIGNVRLDAPAGYQIENLNVSITPKVVDGTSTYFNMRTAKWFNESAGSAQTICSTPNTAVANDLWLIPGSYTLTATYTLRKGEWVNPSVTKTANISLTIGKVHSITGTVPAGDATEISFQVGVDQWTSKDLSATFQ